MNEINTTSQTRRGRPPKEIYTGDFATPEAREIDLDDPDQRTQTFQPAEINSADQQYFSSLAFNEEPITIRLEPSAEKHAPTSVPVWVNGKGAEVLINGKWIAIGYLPIGQILITKRKYVEVLARANAENINTDVIAPEGEDPINKVIKSSQRKYPFSVLKDDNPRGYEWLTRLMYEH